MYIFVWMEGKRNGKPLREDILDSLLFIQPDEALCFIQRNTRCRTKLKSSENFCFALWPFKNSQPFRTTLRQ